MATAQLRKNEQPRSTHLPPYLLEQPALRPEEGRSLTKGRGPQELLRGLRGSGLEVSDPDGDLSRIGLLGRVT